MVRRIVIPVCGVLALGGGPLAAQDDDPAQAQQALETVRSRLEALEADLARRSRERDAAQDALRAAELAEARARKRLAGLDGRVAESRSRLADLARSAEAARVELAAELERLGAQLRSAYVAGRDEWLRVLFNGDDPARVGRRLVYAGYLGRQRAAAAAGVRERLEALRAAETRQSEEQARLDGLRAELAGRVAELDAARSERAAAVAALDRRIAGSRAQADQLRAEADALAELVAELTRALEDLPVDAAPFVARRGRLRWPVDGPVRRDFGDPRAEGRLRWQGLLLSVEPGTEVRAVHHGRVIFADWLPGMGLLAIVEHGEGYLSLYGHNRDLLRDVGDWVDPGDVLAHAGDSGGQNEAGLYFEIRKDGRPVDPGPWMR